MKKIAFLLFCIMLLACIPAFSVSAVEGEPKAISTADEFEAMSEVPGNYYLTGDIDFAGRVYENHIVKKLQGTLDGAGHKIYNFSINQTEANSDAGIFLFVGSEEDSTIKNLNVGSADIPIEMNFKVKGKSVAALTATAGVKNGNKTVIFENIHLYVNINSVYEDASYAGNTAGFIGYCQATTQAIFKNCSFNGVLNSGIDNEGTAYRNTAGFVGVNSTNATNTYENCVNNATITQGMTSVEARVTGFVAYCGNAGANLTFTNCVNNGNITAIGDQCDAYVSGFASCPKGLVTMTACTNNGAMNGYWFTGGFLSQVILEGYVMTDCTNTGEIFNGAVCYSASAGYVPTGCEIAFTNFKNTTSAPDVYTEEVETTAPETTEAATDAPVADDTTAAPEVDETTAAEAPEADVTTEEKAPDTETPAENKGCGGMIAGGIIAVVILGAVCVLKKKEY